MARGSKSKLENATEISTGTWLLRSFCSTKSSSRLSGARIRSQSDWRMNSNQYQSRPSLPPIFPPPTTGDSSQLLAALHAQQQHRVNSPASLAALQERTLASNQNLNLGRNPHTGSPLPSINTWTSTGLSPIAMRPPPAATSSIPHHQQPFPRLNEQRPPSPPPVLEKPKPNLKRPRNKRVTAAQKKEMEEAAVESNGTPRIRPG